MQGTPVQEQRFVGFYFACSAAAVAKEVPVAGHYKGLHYKQGIITIEHCRVIKASQPSLLLLIHVFVIWSMVS